MDCKDPNSDCAKQLSDYFSELMSAFSTKPSSATSAFATKVFRAGCPKGTMSSLREHVKTKPDLNTPLTGFFGVAAKGHSHKKGKELIFNYQRSLGNLGSARPLHSLNHVEI
jgi:hypothetical protein